MRKLEGDVGGPLVVDDEVEITGTIQGGATVTGLLDLRGTCDGDLVVEHGGDADLEAVVHGRIRVAEGARLRLRGIVDGAMGFHRRADVGLAVGTVIAGRQLQADGSFVELAGPQDITFSDDTLVLRLTEEGTWVPGREFARQHPDPTLEMPSLDLPGARVAPTHVRTPPDGEASPSRGRHAHPDDD